MNSFATLAKPNDAGSQRAWVKGGGDMKYTLQRLLKALAHVVGGGVGRERERSPTVKKKESSNAEVLGMALGLQKREEGPLT